MPRVCNTHDLFANREVQGSPPFNGHRPTYLALDGQRSFSHRQARPLAFAYPGFVLVALLVSIPYRRWLGLIG